MNSVELIKNVSMSVLWQPLTPRNASPKLGVWAHTYALPMNRPIIYDVRKSKGILLILSFSQILIMCKSWLLLTIKLLRLYLGTKVLYV